MRRPKPLCEYKIPTSNDDPDLSVTLSALLRLIGEPRTSARVKEEDKPVKPHQGALIGAVFRPIGAKFYTVSGCHKKNASAYTAGRSHQSSPGGFLWSAPCKKAQSSEIVSGLSSDSGTNC